MTTKKFSNALGNIGESYVDEAVNYTAKKKSNTWLKWGAIAACFCLMITVFAIVIPYIPDGNHAGDGDIAMLFTEAKVVEIYSSRSVLVEITAENIYNANTKKNLFQVGDMVQAEFNEAIVLHFVPGDIVVIGRGNTANVDYSQRPYIAQCNSINIKAKEDYRNIKVGVENGEWAEHAGIAFVNRVYSEHFINLPEDSHYRITDYKIIDYTMTEMGDNFISGEFSFAIKATNPSYYADKYAMDGTGEFEGWIILRKRFTLECGNSAYWNCIELENIPMSTKE